MHSGGAAGFDELRKNWWILPPCVAGTMLSAAHAYSLGVMIPVLEKEFGWLRAEISVGMLIVAVIALFAAPLSGMLVDRLGTRIVALMGVPVFCGSLALLSMATGDIRTWWLLWVLLGLANMLVMPAIWVKAISACFDANRGMALAIALAGTGLASAIIPSLTNALVQAMGWRNAYVALALIAGAVVWPLAFWLLRPDKARVASRAQAAAAAAIDGAGVSPREGFTMPSFLKLAGATMLFAFVICVFTTNGVPVLVSRGFDSTTAAAIAGLTGLGSITGRLIGGYLLDRFNGGLVAAVSALVPMISAALLLFFPASPATAGAAFFILGLTAGAEIDCVAYLAAKHFGLRSFGTLFGMLNGLMLFGNGVSPLLANYVYDVTRSYDIVLWVILPVCMITALLFLTLGPYRDFDENPSEENAPLPKAAPA